jgi:SpoIID/LytB domain protein
VAAVCTGALALATLVGPSAAAQSAPAAKRKVPVSVTLKGAGWGHGVGLSQYGALGMAKEGATAEQIVRHYYTGTTVGAVKDDVELRVNLLHGPAAVTMRGEALATGGGRMQVKLKGEPAVQVAPGDRLRLIRKATTVKVVLRPAAGGKSVLGRAAAVALRWAGTRKPGRTGSVASQLDVATTFTGLDGSGHRYRYGMVKVWPSRGAGLEVVNFVQVHEEYLRGIAEVPSSWPAAALQAQVLAARSYALAKYAAGVRRDCRCHVDDGGGPYYDQTFVGDAKATGPSGKAWTAAVSATVASATTGKAVLYQGKPITAFYSSSTGGRTQSSKDVWGGDLPWAQSVDDRWSLDPAINPNASWKVDETQARMAALFGLPDVVELDLSDLTAGDALRTVTATSSTGATKTISGPTFAGGLGLKSRWVSAAKLSYATGS